MAGLGLDFEVLRSSVTALGDIASSLSNVADGSLSEGIMGEAIDWSHPGLTRVLNEVADTVAREKGTLDEAIQDTGEWIERVIEEFEARDEELTRSLHDAHSRPVS